MKQEPIIFKQGEENGIVIERDNFKNSIFISQYQQAIKTFCHIWAQQTRYLEDNNQPAKFWTKYGVDNLFANVIAFCGDRGEGKSSSMMSFSSILTEEKVRENAVNSLELDNTVKDKFSQIKTDKIELLGVIDPSFFDHEHNLLELLLGRMHSNISKVIEEKEKDPCSEACVHDHRPIMEQFQKVKSCLSILEKGNKIYDEIENLNDLAAGINLQENLHKLFDCYAQFMHKERLVVCIDDIDLNILEGYKMAELLRKYLLTCPRLIVLVAVKIDQLEDVIANAHKLIFNNEKISWDDCQQMARKYTAKLLPRGNRILMPSIDEISERDLIIIDETGEERGDRSPVKESVVQMIFQKTGYVFYNTRYLSPIIPRNLRSLRHLLATLISLPDARDEKWNDNETGREVFKEYFFETWVNNNLKVEDRGFAEQVAHYQDLSTLNAFVVEYMANRANERDMDDVSGKEADFAELYKKITSRKNTAANISYGDVMYVLWMINSITVDIYIQSLIFYLKTIYSMRLYACYNIISQKPDDSTPSNLYPPTPDVENEVHIHQADRWYEHVNQVQRLVNGSYFTYPQGALLPKTIEDQYRDKKTIDFRVLKKWLLEIKGAYNKKTKKLKSDKLLLLQVSELMALYIVRTTDKDEKEKDLGHNRTAKVPSHLWQFSNTARYAIIDFLQPFYSLCNIEYAYRRFDNIMGVDEKDTTYSLYDMAINTKDSLLNQLYDSSFTVDEKDKEKSKEEIFWKKQHLFISDSVIRISDVQWAIYDELLRSRDLHKSTDVIHLAYKDIQDLKIKLYPLNREDNPNHEAHILNFNFLPILSSYFSKDFDINTKKDKNQKQKEFEYIQSKLNEICIIDRTELRKLRARIDLALKETLRQPQNGGEIRNVICDATDFDEAQKLLFAEALTHIYDEDKSYSYAAAKKKISEVLAQYMTLKEISNE